MFIKTTRRRRGDRTYEYLSLVESERVEGKIRHRTLLRLGEVTALRASGQLDRIIAALRRHAEGVWVEADEVDVEAAPAVGSVAAAATYWERLGLDIHFQTWAKKRRLSYDLGGAVFAMVANRLCDPSSKRRIPEWLTRDVVWPVHWAAPTLDQLYWALDQVAAAKEATEDHLYRRLTDLTNLDLRLVCYDLTSTYLETRQGPSERFESRAFGYSRDQRGDRPQIVIGLLTTGDGIPIAHEVFAGNTRDSTTLPGVLDTLQDRFGLGRICVVADRGLITAENLAALTEGKYDHVLATRLHRDPTAKAAIAASSEPAAIWRPVSDARSAACEVSIDGRRHIVVASPARLARDDRRRRELIAKTEGELLTLEQRVRRGDLKDARKITAAAEAILSRSPIRRVFDVEIDTGHFLYHYNEDTLAYEEALAGRYILTTSLSTDQASTARVVNIYRALQDVEARFRTLKDFLRLRPIYHWTERRVRGHVAVCMLAVLIETLIRADLATAGITDPDLPKQTLSAPRALRELDRIRTVTLTTPDHTINAVTRRDTRQTAICKALHIDTTSWDRPHIQ